MSRVSQCIYIVRNPINAMLSRVNHYILEGARWVDSDWGRKRLMKSFISEANAKSRESHKSRFDGGWNNHVVSWLEENVTIPIHVIKYEDLVKDKKAVLTEVNEKLALNFKKSHMDFAIKTCEFKNMQEIEKYELENEIPGMFYSEVRKKRYKKTGRTFVNKGKLDSRTELDHDLKLLFNSEFERGLALADYSKLL